MRTPVLFITFNRPDHASITFESIRKARPERLYIASDGPREDKPGEAELVQEVRKIIERVDWPCKVETLFRKRNQGCAIAVSSAITWFFSKEPEGIVLEDDLLPHEDFFTFCETMLERYRDNPRIGCITGNNFQLGARRGDGAYYYSYLNHCWGWASWARAWKYYDHSMNQMRHCTKNILPALHEDRSTFQGLITRFEHTLCGKVNSWAYRWQLAAYVNEMLTVTPNHNLAKNIGFGTGTHCTARCLWENIQTFPMSNFNAPSTIEADLEADKLALLLTQTSGGTAPISLLHIASTRLGSPLACSVPEVLRLFREFYGHTPLADQIEQALDNRQ